MRRAATCRIGRKKRAGVTGLFTLAIHLGLFRTGGEPEHCEVDMRANPKAILAAIGVAALLTSSAMAKAVRHHHAAPSIVPSYAQRSVAPCGYGSFDNPVNPPCHEAFGFCTC